MMAFKVTITSFVLVSLWVLLTDGYAIPGATSQIEDNTANNGLSASLTDAATIPVANDGFETEIELLSGEGESHKRSVSTDINNSNPPAGFAIFEGVSDSELGPFLQAVGSHQGLTLPTHSGLSIGHGCSANNNLVVDFSKFGSQCPTSLAPASSDMNLRGLCPWTYMNHTDVNRYPETMLYAQCECRDCVLPDGQHFTEGGCQPIEHEVKVLRKHSCQNGIQVYERRYEKIPVGCACVRSRHD